MSTMENHIHRLYTELAIEYFEPVWESVKPNERIYFAYRNALLDYVYKNTYDVVCHLICNVEDWDIPNHVVMNVLKDVGSNSVCPYDHDISHLKLLIPKFMEVLEIDTKYNGNGNCIVNIKCNSVDKKLLEFLLVRVFAIRCEGKKCDLIYNGEKFENVCSLYNKISKESNKDGRIKIFIEQTA